MRFIVMRTSARSSEKPPCKGATRGTFTRVDRRTTNDPKTIPVGKGSDGVWWYAEGENHRVVKGQIARDFPGEEAWFIEIPDLAALIAFMDRHGELVIGPDLFSEEYRCLEIYDDYRE